MSNLGKRQGRVIKVNQVPSEKLKMFSTIISFRREIDTEYGKAIANEGYFGVALTEKMPTNLKAGDLVNCEIVSFQKGTHPTTGLETVAAQCLLFGKAEEAPKRVEAAKEKAEA